MSLKTGIGILLASFLSVISKSCYNDSLSAPVTYQVYECSENTDAKVLSIYNTNGNIKIGTSDTEDLKVKVQLIQTSKIYDLNKKKSSLIIEPQIVNDIIFYEPLYAEDHNKNYWQYLSNYNGIYMDFIILIPSSIKEVRLYCELGNIDIQDVVARIYAQTECGNITGQNITPLDRVTLITNSGVPGRGAAINTSFKSLEKTNIVAAGVFPAYDINLKIPVGAGFEHMQTDDLVVEYPYSLYSDKRFDYCREQCLAPFVPIKNKQKESTTIITTLNDDGVSKVTIKE